MGSFLNVSNVSGLYGRIALSLICLAVLAMFAPACYAEPTEPAAQIEDEVQEAGLTLNQTLCYMGACLGAALAAIGGGMGIAKIGISCLESVARQPEAAGAMFAPMVVAAAMIEGGMLFAIVVCLFAILK